MSNFNKKEVILEKVILVLAIGMGLLIVNRLIERLLSQPEKLEMIISYQTTGNGDFIYYLTIMLFVAAIGPYALVKTIFFLFDNENKPIVGRVGKLVIVSSNNKSRFKQNKGEE